MQLTIFNGLVVFFKIQKYVFIKKKHSTDMNKVNSKGLCHSPTPFCHRLLVSIDYVLNTTLYNNSMR